MQKWHKSNGIVASLFLVNVSITGVRHHTSEAFGDSRATLGFAAVYKLLLCLLLALVLVAPAWAETPSPERSQTVDKNRDAPRIVPPEPESPSPLTAAMVTTLNGSTLGRVKPSVNQRINLDYTLPGKQVIDLRLEYYTEGSYNADPPGELNHNINEPKFEGQLTYTAPVTDRFSLSGAVLHHENFRFQDTYWWGIVTAGYTVHLLDALTVVGNLSGEERFSGGRPFLDFSGTVDYDLSPVWTLEGNLHRYENYGQSDPSPTQKREYELAVIRNLPHTQFVGLSYFRHVQFGAPNDQFSFIKLKYGITF